MAWPGFFSYLIRHINYWLYSKIKPTFPGEQWPLAENIKALLKELKAIPEEELHTSFWQ